MTSLTEAERIAYHWLGDQDHGKQAAAEIQAAIDAVYLKLGREKPDSSPAAPALSEAQIEHALENARIVVAGAWLDGGVILSREGWEAQARALVQVASALSEARRKVEELEAKDDAYFTEVVNDQKDAERRAKEAEAALAEASRKVEALEAEQRAYPGRRLLALIDECNEMLGEPEGALITESVRSIQARATVAEKAWRDTVEAGRREDDAMRKELAAAEAHIAELLEERDGRDVRHSATVDERDKLRSWMQDIAALAENTTNHAMARNRAEHFARSALAGKPAAATPKQEEQGHE